MKECPVCSAKMGKYKEIDKCKGGGKFRNMGKNNAGGRKNMGACKNQNVSAMFTEVTNDIRGATAISSDQTEAVSDENRLNSPDLEVLIWNTMLGRADWGNKQQARQSKIDDCARILDTYFNACSL